LQIRRLKITSHFADAALPHCRVSGTSFAYPTPTNPIASDISTDEHATRIKKLETAVFSK